MKSLGGLREAHSAPYPCTTVVGHMTVEQLAECHHRSLVWWHYGTGFDTYGWKIERLAGLETTQVQ